MAVIAAIFPITAVTGKSIAPSEQQTNLRLNKIRTRPPPLFLSTNPSHINSQHLIDLYATSNLSGHRFPALANPDGGVEPVDSRKLRIALSHSSVVVSVFCRTQDIPNLSSCLEPVESSAFQLKNVLPVSHYNGELVGFGRAVSDNSLTASIYDVMVIPALRGMGVGKMIVKRIVRMLTSMDIYDIAALCSEKERFFFRACGFGDDTLGATTMMYTRSGSNCTTDAMITSAGRKMLLIPSGREPFTRLSSNQQ